MTVHLMKRRMILVATGAAFAVAAAIAAPAMAQPAKSARYEMRDQSNRNVRVAAEAGLRSMVFDMGRGLPANGKLPADFPIAVSSYAELRQVALGVGFEVNTIDPTALAYAGKSADLGAMSKGTGLWNFVLLSKGQPVGLLEVGNVGGRWQVLGAGASALARDVQAAAQGHARDGRFKFVRLYQATSDLMQVRGADGSTRFVPLMAARETLGLAKAAAGDSLPSGQALLPALQQAVRASLSRNAR